MNSHDNLADKRINQVIAKAHTTFVGGHLFNVKKIREVLKEEIKQAIHTQNSTDTSASQFDVLFESLYGERFIEKCSGLGEEEKKSQSQLKLQLPLLRRLINLHEIEKKLTAKYHQEITPTELMRLKQELIRRHPDSVVKCTPSALYALFAEKNRLNVISELYEAQKTKLSAEAISRLNQLIKQEAKRKKAWEEEQEARKHKAGNNVLDEDFDVDCFLEEDVFDYVLQEEFNKQFKRELKNEIQSEKENKSEATVRERRHDERYLLYRDACFPDYDANWIHGTHYIAAKGPKDKTLGAFIHHLIFSEQMAKQARQVKKIVALGNCVRKTDHFGLDFVNYAMPEKGEIKLKYFDNRYLIKATVGYCSEDYVVSGEVRNFAGSRPREPYGLVVSNLAISEGSEAIRVVDVIMLGMPDNHSIFIDENETEAEIIKEVLWQLAQESNAVAIHCAAGVGRTGHLLLLLHLIKEYDAVFAGDDIDAIDQRIEAIIKRLRGDRPPLLSAIQQKECAIRIAHQVHEYALKNKYITGAARLSELNFLVPRFTSQPQSIVSSAVENKPK